MAREKITAETEVSTSELAAVLGLTVRRVQQLSQDGIIPTVSRGKFLLREAVARFIDYRTRLMNRDDDSAEAKAALDKIVAEAKLKTAKADVAALEADELKGTMHRAEDVEILVNDLVYTIRSSLGALPGRVALDAFAAKTPEELSNVVRREVRKILRELAGHRYDPAKYEELVRQRREWSTEMDDEE